MISARFKVGQLPPCVVWHEERELRCALHVNDFVVPVWQADLDLFWTNVSGKFASTRRGCLGPGTSDTREIRIVNRTITWRRQGSKTEHFKGQRNVEIYLHGTGLKEENREIGAPTDRSSKHSSTRCNLISVEKDATSYPALEVWWLA